MARCHRFFPRSRSSSRVRQRSISSGPESEHHLLAPLHHHDAAALASRLRVKGYAPTSHPLLGREACRLVRERMPRLFRGEFDTGIYPDEWHWREGISKPHAAREMCNAWKSDRTIASIVLNERLGNFIANVMGWESVRIAQDDLVWKPPSSSNATPNGGGNGGRIDTVGFHQDSAYISAQFEPYEHNSVTVWMTLDDADGENGCVEYAAGSHDWRPILHRMESAEQQDDASVADSSDSANNELSSFHSSDETSYRDGLSHAANLAGVSDPIGTIEAAPVREGFAILHHQDVWHGSGPNRSPDRHRRALVAHYLRGDVTFRESTDRRGGPFGSSSYIYGRYRRYGSVEVDENFFPIVAGEGRSRWIDEYLEA